MDQVKIGKFIAECRKKVNLTQMQLAEKLNITDRAVSKWECGRAMPDTSIMLELCDILGISVNELLSGGKISMENNNQKNEQLLLDMAKELEKKTKTIWSSMWAIMIVSMVALISGVLVAALLIPEGVWQLVTILGICVLFLIPCFYALKLEISVGAYKCRNCGHEIMPTYKQALNAMHRGTTRYLKCPECQKRTWCKKVLEREPAPAVDGGDTWAKETKKEGFFSINKPWISFIAVILILALALLFAINDMKDLRYVCPDCDSTFEITFGEYSKAMHSFSKRKLTCPDCGATNMCEKYRGE